MTLHHYDTNVLPLKASRMLNLHAHLTYLFWDKKTSAYKTSMASPSRQLTFKVRVSCRCIIAVAESGRSRWKWWSPLKVWVWALRRVWALPSDGDEFHSSTHWDVRGRWWWPVLICVYLCMLVCQYWPALMVLCSTSGSDTRARLNRHGFGHSWDGVLR